MPSAITLNGLRVIQARVSLGWLGAWTAELVLDLDAVADMPSGACVLVVSNQSLPCTVDPQATATFRNRAGCRVVGGANGWSTIVPAQHFHKDAGNLLAAEVYDATAALIGETISDPDSPSLGIDFARVEGPARDVFQARNWYVDPTTGVTTLGDWVSSVVADGTTIREFDVVNRVATLSSEDLIFPGCVLDDVRFNGVSYVVRDVELTYGPDGNTIVAWCSESAASRLPSVLSSLVNAMSGARYLKTYSYRFDSDSDGGLALTAVSAEAPDLNPIAQWVGLSGYSAEIASGATIIVGFVEGDARYPYLVSFSPLDGKPSKQSFVSTGKFVVMSEGRDPKSHVATVEGVVNMFINFVYFLNSAGDISMWALPGKILDPMSFPTQLLTGLQTWLQSCNLPTPPLPIVGGGLLLPPIKSAIDSALSSKQPNPLGLQPGVGAPGFEVE